MKLTQLKELKQDQVKKTLQKENKKRIKNDFNNQEVFIEERRSSKFDPPYSGPYKVIRVKPERNIAQIDLGSKLQWFNIRKLKPRREGNMSWS